MEQQPPQLPEMQLPPQAPQQQTQQQTPPQAPYTSQYQSPYCDVKPKFTTTRLVLQTVLILIFSGILALVATGVDSIAWSDKNDELLSEATYTLVTSATGYCFIMITITLLALTLVEIAFRREINPIQYGLTGAALWLFFLMLLAFAEHMHFVIAYTIVGAMTTGLITLFVKGITHNAKAIGITAGLLVIEYAVVLMLLYMGSLALLVGSCVLFTIIALAMYFTLKLKVVDDELIIE